jgi:hypothetical protein
MPRQSSRRRPQRTTTSGFVFPDIPRRKLHIGFAITGLLMLAFYFSPFIVDGWKRSQAPDAMAAAPLLNMSHKWHLEHDEMPLWTPAVFSGMPSYGSMIYNHAEPLTEPVNWIAGKAWAGRENFGLRLLWFYAIAGLSIYLLLIRYDRSPIAAFFAATVYVFTPYIPGLLAAGHHNKVWAAALIPPLLLVTDGLLRGRSFRSFLWFALIVAWQLWVRHPQVTYYGMLLIGMIVLADVFVTEGNWLFRARRFGINALLVGGGLTLAVGMTALPYLPILDFTPNSVRGGTPSAASELRELVGEQSDRSWEFATQWSMHPKETVSFAFPSFYGLWNDSRYDGQTQLEAHTYWGFMPFTQSTHYFGLVPLLLALLVRPNRRALIWGSIAFTILALFIGFGSWFPVIYWPAYKLLPMFSKFRVPSMIYMLLPLSVGIIAAWALDTLIDTNSADTDQPKRGQDSRFRREEKIALGAAALIGVFSLVTIVFNNGWSWTIRPQEAQYGPQILAALADLRGSLIVRDLLIALALTVVVASGVWLVSRRRIDPTIFGFVVIVITLADLGRLDATFLDAVPKAVANTPVAKPAAVDAIWNDAGEDSVFRIAPLRGIGQGGQFVLDPTNEYGRWSLPSVSGYHAAKLRIYDDLMIMGGLGRRQVLDMLNTQYFIGPPGLNTAGILPLNRGQSVAYKNVMAMPRAWWVDRIEHATSRADALNRVISPMFTPATTAVVLAADDLGEIGTRPGIVPTITEWGFHRIILETSTDEPAYLVLSEVFYPDWVATIDGDEVPIYQTNFVLRGVHVPAGDHVVSFEYRSKSAKTATMLTWTLFPLVLMGVVALEAVRWRQQRGEPVPDELRPSGQEDKDTA